MKRWRKKGSKNKPKQVPLGDLTNKIGKYSLRTLIKKDKSLISSIKQSNTSKKSAP